MDLTDVRKNMYVSVSELCTHTKRDFGWNEHMDKYKGTIQRIKNTHRSVVRFDCIEGFNWSAKDLMPAAASISEKQPISFLFDANNLDL